EVVLLAHGVDAEDERAPEEDAAPPRGRRLEYVAATVKWSGMEGYPVYRDLSYRTHIIIMVAGRTQSDCYQLMLTIRALIGRLKRKVSTL
ncbi:hypothetical protein PRIPAC_70648, partial [Pristionchus pacificus]|uniref:Uncharacterized protein n=1 Tax=Pristionchus pacificus TaxID=54126 RepID=A0A2A6C0U8_PRIPA